jgi:hypothetical protein
MGMARNMAKSAKYAKKTALFAKLRTYCQTKMGTNKKGPRSKTTILSDASIENRPWILQILFSTTTRLPTQSMLY